MPHAFANTLKTFKTASGKSGQVLLAAGAGPAVSQDRPPAGLHAHRAGVGAAQLRRQQGHARARAAGRQLVSQRRPHRGDSRSSSRAWCCRTSPACRCWPTWRPCAASRRGWASRPGAIEPLVPVDLVVDHSIMVDHYGTKDALDLNMKLEFQRNRERYEFMKWGMQAFEHLRRGAARLRHRAPGEPGVPGARRAQHGRRRVLPRHAGGHRQPHHDDQRHRRGRLGRGRHRGRGRDAGPAGLHADARRGRLRAHRAGCAKAAPRPTWCSP